MQLDYLKTKFIFRSINFWDYFQDKELMVI